MLIGLGKIIQDDTQARLRRRSFVLIVLGTVLVAIPLSLTAYRSVVDTISRNKATTVVQEWLQGTSNQIVAINVDGQLVAVSIEGVDQLKSVNELAKELEKAFQHPVTVRLRVVPTKVEFSQSSSSP